MTDEVQKPLPFAILLRSTINPAAQVVVKHYAFSKAELWGWLQTERPRFAARNEAGEVDALVDMSNAIVNVLTWEEYEQLAAEAQKAQMRQRAAELFVPGLRPTGPGQR